MSLIKVKDMPNIYYSSDQYISGVKEVTKRIASKAGLDRQDSGKSFKLVVRFAPIINGKQVQKKKTYTFRATTFANALYEIRDEPLKSMELAKAKPEELEVITNHITILNDAWADFYKHKTTTKRKPWKDRTAKDLESFYNSWIKQALGDKKVVEIKKRHVEDLVEVVATQRSLRTAKKVVDCLRPMFNRFYDRFDIERRNPASIEFGDLGNAREIIVTPAQAKKIYDAIYNYPIEPIRSAMIMLGSGRRLSEVTSLHTDQICKGYYTILAKNNKAKVDMEYKMPDGVIVPNRGYAFTSLRGYSTPLSGASLRNHFIRAVKASKCDKVKINKKMVLAEELHVHDVRHILGGILKRAEIPAEFRGLLLGHSDKAIITERYSSGAPDIADKVYRFFLEHINQKVNVWKEFE